MLRLPPLAREGGGDKLLKQSHRAVHEGSFSLGKQMPLGMLRSRTGAEDRQTISAGMAGGTNLQPVQIRSKTRGVRFGGLHLLVSLVFRVAYPRRGNSL